MPSLQLSQEEVQNFELYFKAAVEQRTGETYTELLETYIAYQNLDEHRRQRFWEYVSNATNLPRERVYKFFRFTWSRQFYSSITDHRENIKALVCQILDELRVDEKTAQINSQVWNRVWAVYKDYNLHYDGTDQFVRNCVNLYFTKKGTGQPFQVGQIVMPPKPAATIATLSKSRPKIMQQEPAPTPVVERIEEVKISSQPIDLYNYFGKVIEPEDFQHVYITNYQYTYDEQESVEVDSTHDEFDIIRRTRQKPRQQSIAKRSMVGFVSYNKYTTDYALFNQNEQSDINLWEDM
ncbi:Conserved_hypothetical protein [Hexamita inflata]|uniref:Uncharacterized protein n=1 Tax=Hexamita inflata TaxID=28002 RepID=A0AA86Q6F9_9EUKA|nr:Conserved hypothetical protein [Hexamita inflata]CAI9946880.1 Conserved hypothetical protein [Hexamita inflata]CAI9967232.1 Conserved hypothetical protein [Hexamita inflata]